MTVVQPDEVLYRLSYRLNNVADHKCYARICLAVA